MNDLKDKRFRSYLLDEESLESISLSKFNKTKLLDGEYLITEASRVMMFSSLSDRKKGTLGTLTVTTFKLSFISGNDKDNENMDEYYQNNLLLDPFEVCLSSIDVIYQLGERTKKKLVCGQNVSGKIKELLVICKNMRVFEFSFKFADKDCGKSVANALLHHSCPKRHPLLFAYEYKKPYNRTLKDVRMFRNTNDWETEMKRTGCKNWRVSSINLNFHMSPLLPRTIIVPASVTDSALSRAVEHFRNRCCPVWVWGTHKGSALVRMSDLLSTITDRTQENIMLEHIRKSHNEKRQPYIMDLSKDCPSPKDIQISYLRLRDLCIPDSIRLFKTQDYKFYGLLDSTKWLTYVSTCLSKAAEGAKEMCPPKPVTVVLQEGNGRDMNCIISSLIQLYLDPHWRTLSGFQSLIEKEWVALGHPFASRHCLVAYPDSEPAPLLLLFLDCVWQLLQQFPTAFEITETYLTTIWDSAHISVFDTFLFNSEHERYLSQTSTTPMILRSIWDWKEQFTEKDIALFYNPLYDDRYTHRLIPNTAIAFLDIWLQCYSRWLPDLEIRNGGKPQIDLCSRFLRSEIHVLKQKLDNGDLNDIAMNGNTNEYLTMLKKVDCFFPFSRNHGQITGTLAINSSLLSGDTLDTQSILNHAAAND
ncbi:hypothetical protein RN001_007005 [Aquatica leii]|uniref:Myotubularin phosphatase domain-containing protein n=1 Tax=Aquatica leii TaxID=1421715 RepID=A0AAN7PLP0_9COLE|nr:hypothetical protein RN001_007005 [Aquatica leii]